MTRFTKAQLEKALGEVQELLVAERKARNADVRKLNALVGETCRERDEYRQQLWGDVHSQLESHAKNVERADDLARAEREARKAREAAQQLEHRVEVAELKERNAELEGALLAEKRDRERDRLRAESSWLRQQNGDLRASLDTARHLNRRLQAEKEARS